MTTKTVQTMDVSTLSDTELIVASKGDPSAFGVLFDRHVRDLYRFVWRRMGSTFANDLTAETFTIAFARRVDFQADRGEVLPWLYGIATNVIRNHLRVERKQLLSTALLGAVAASDAIEDVEDRVDASRAFAQLARGLADLQPGDRDVLLLFAWTDLGYEGIAQALEIPTGTVGSRLNRARRILRSTLDEFGYFSNDHIAKEAGR